MIFIHVRCPIDVTLRKLEVGQKVLHSIHLKPRPLIDRKWMVSRAEDKKYILPDDISNVIHFC